MREVAWVVFDEIHYMRDKCEQALSPRNGWISLTRY